MNLAPIPATLPDWGILAEKLPAAPKIFGRLQRLLADGNSDVESISTLVRVDASLTSRVIRLANSAMYSFSEPVSSLEEAINRVGFREVLRLVGLVASQGLFSREVVAYGLEGEQLWQNCLATAIATEMAARCHNLDPYDHYIHGLLRSLGKVVLNHHFISGGGTGDPYPGCRIAPSLMDWEKKSFGITSPEVAAKVLRIWSFPEEVVKPITRQYYLDPLDRNPGVELEILRVGMLVAIRLGKGLPPEAGLLESSDAMAVLGGRFSNGQIENLIMETRSSLNSTLGALD